MFGLVSRDAHSHFAEIREGEDRIRERTTKSPNTDVLASPGLGRPQHGATELLRRCFFRQAGALGSDN